MQEKKVKRKRPIASWARWFLKLTQHVSASVAILCLAALILTSTVYVEDFYGRRWINSDIRDDKAAGTYLVQNLSWETENAIRLAIIRSQLEVDGKFEGDRQVNISEYYYRKNANRYNNIQQYTYFPGATYYLEDLIRWQQAGGLRMVDERVENRFLTIDGMSLERLVHSEAEYKTLCDQLSACMSDLSNNYDEYQRYMKQYKEGQTSFVYYIDLDNGTDDIYTNASFLEKAGSAKEAQSYFGGLVCAAMGTTALNYSVQGNYEIDVDNVADFMSQYDYAMGDNAVVYTGFDMSLGVNDYYATLWNAFDSYNMDYVYMLLGIIISCGLYYLLVTLYMLVVSGRKTDKAGEEFIELKWVDGIYLEVFLSWCVLLGIAVTAAFCELYEFYLHSRVNFIRETGAIVICTVSFFFSVLIVESLCSLARRVKSKTLFKNSIIYKFCVSQVARFTKYLEKKAHSLKLKIQYYMERSGLWEKTWGLFLIEVVFFTGCLFLFFVFMHENERMALGVAMVILMTVAFTSYRRLKRKEEREEIIEKIEDIVAGESSRVNVERLSVENAALGNAVNEIGEGIRQAVEKSIKDERLKAELLTNVSHDIKTPLTSIISYVDLLKKEQIENEKAMEYIKVLENKSLKLKNLIQDLIEVSKISTGNIEYEMISLNLHELIMQAVAEYDEKFTGHCLKLIYNNDAKEACIMADPRRMWRVMENLLSNVYKYALEGTRVYLDVIRNNDKLIFTMKNISAKELNIHAEELAERFVRGDLSRTTEGSGLGLAIAQNLVLGQGGELKIMLDGDLFKVQVTFRILENK